MKRRLFTFLLAGAAAIGSIGLASNNVQAAGEGQPADWNRFYHYPYVYYPHNFQQPRQNDHLYHRYPPSMRIPVYNRSWYNFYPQKKPYHSGHHFILDIF